MARLLDSGRVGIVAGDTAVESGNSWATFESPILWSRVRRCAGQILLRTLKYSPEERLAALREIEQSALFCPSYDPHDRAHDEHFQPLLAEMVAKVQALPDGILGQRYFLGELRKQPAPTKPASR